MNEKLVFEQTIDGLFRRGLKGQVTPRLKRRLADAGLDLDKKLLPAYPFADWCTFVSLASEELHGPGNVQVGYRLLGERVVDGFKESMLGTALFSVIKVLGPRRALMRVRQNFRSGNNYTEGEVFELTPTSYEVWMNEIGDIRYLTSGVLLAGVRALGAPQASVEVKTFDDAGVTYCVFWPA